jgi:transcriptional regulator with XRE-family HTH domain
MINTIKLRQLRERHSYSTAELAKKLNVSQPYVTQIERGIRRPSVNVLHRYTTIFDCTLDDLMVKKA